MPIYELIDCLMSTSLAVTLSGQLILFPAHSFYYRLIPFPHTLQLPYATMPCSSNGFVFKIRHTILQCPPFDKTFKYVIASLLHSSGFFFFYFLHESAAYVCYTYTRKNKGNFKIMVMV